VAIGRARRAVEVEEVVVGIVVVEEGAERRQPGILGGTERAVERRRRRDRLGRQVVDGTGATAGRGSVER
jgi:hypothetical protein